MKPLIWLFALFSLLTLTREADDGSHDTVKVVDGEDAILPCQLKEPFSSIITVSWECNGTIVHFYRSKADYLVNQHKNFLGRTSLLYELAKGNFSLTLTNVTELDAGNYTCKGRVNETLEITLIVEPKQTEGNPTNILGQSKGNMTDSPGHQDNQVIGISIVAGFGALIVIVIVIVIYKCKNYKKAKKEPALEPQNDLSIGTSPRCTEDRGYTRQRSKETDNPVEMPLMNKGSTSDGRT